MSAAEDLAPEQSVDEVRESLFVTEKGQPANTIGNCRTVFCHDPLLRDAIRLNLLTDRVDIVRDLGWRRNTSALTDTDVKYLLLYFEQNYGLTSEKKMTAALSIVANENCYHPIQDVLNSLVWDGTPRIRSSWSGQLYGYGWWIAAVSGMPVLFAWGYGGQMLYVVPDMALTVVMLSDPAAPRDPAPMALLHALLAEGIMPARGAPGPGATPEPLAEPVPG